MKRKDLTFIEQTFEEEQDCRDCPFNDVCNSLINEVNCSLCYIIRNKTI